MKSAARVTIHSLPRPASKFRRESGQLLSACDVLNPHGERVPGRRLSDRNPDLLYRNQKRAAPRGYAVNLTRGPEIIREQEKQKGIGGKAARGAFL